MNLRCSQLPRQLVAPMVLALAACLAGGQSAATQPGGAGEASLRERLKNPLMPGQDPSVVWHAGSFYLVQSAAGSVFVMRSATVAGLATASREKVWTALPPMNREVWAPDLSWVPQAGADGRGRWYIYVAADDGENAHHRLFALESRTTEPTEGFTLKAQLAAPGADRWAIDASLLQVASGEARRLYLLWSGWEGEKNIAQHLYIAPMSNPWTISGSRVKISSPDQPWETRSGPSPCLVNEGPQAAVHNGQVVVTYSANGFWSDDYCLGLLTCPADKVLDPAAWKKQGPVFSKSSEVFATGHNCLVDVQSGPDAGWWLMYHGIALPGQNGRGRQLYAQPFTWNDAGLPVFGTPLVSPAR